MEIAATTPRTVWCVGAGILKRAEVPAAFVITFADIIGVGDRPVVVVGVVTSSTT